MKPISDFSKIKKWKGFKLEPTMSVNYANPHKNQKIILFNPVFWTSLNDYQRFFILTWCFYAHKTKSEDKADKQAKKYYVNMGYNIQHILDMYVKMTHANMDVKTGRMYMLLTDKLNIKEKWIRFIQKVNSWMKKIFQNGK